MKVWLGAKRRDVCPRVNICGKLDTFEWTDGSTTGTDGFWWGGNEPNGFITANLGQQNCLVQLVSGNSGWAYTCGKRA